MEWTTDIPTEPGTYWVYAKDLLRANGSSLVLCFNVDFFPCGGIYVDYGVVSQHIGLDDITHWMGPIEEPEPPQEGQATTIMILAPELDNIEPGNSIKIEGAGNMDGVYIVSEIVKTDNGFEYKTHKRSNHEQPEQPTAGQGQH